MQVDISEPQQIVFEYVGMTSMLAEGMVTRQRYYFPEPGARVPVDLRDRAGLLRAPNLREAAESNVI
jgi:hypothetical protein